MKLVFSNDVFAVIDDFLPQSDFYKIWNFIQTEKFRFVHSSEWVNAFNLEDGTPTGNIKFQVLMFIIVTLNGD